MSGQSQEVNQKQKTLYQCVWEYVWKPYSNKKQN